MNASARRLLAAVVVAATSVAATAGLATVFDAWTFLLPAAAGSATALAIALVSQRLRWMFAETLAASAAAIVVVGILLVGGPTPAGAADFFSALGSSWADLLSAVPPAPMTAELRVPPLLLAWVGCFIGTTVLRRVRVSALPAVGPATTLVLTILLSAADETISLVVGTVLAVVTLVLVIVQRRFSPLAVGIVVAVGVAAPFLGPHLPLADANERYDLRDEIEPPWDPLALPSPLVDTKASLVAEREDEVVFTYESEVPLDRWTLATMSDFDGVVWTVADPRRPAESEFRAVGPELPEASGQLADGEMVTATVDVVGLDGPWIPTPGWGRAIAIEADVAVRENLDTGTLALPGGVPAGSSYRIEAELPPAPTDEELRARSVPTDPEDIDLEVVPPQIRNLAADLTEGIDSGWGQIAAIRDRFVDTGFYDKSETSRPGHSYYRLSQFLVDPDNVVGYEEQYAAAAAVIARIAAIPARVVAGYEVPADRWVDGAAEVRAGDRTAWIEVLVDEVGWVPVDVTPPRSREPNVDTATTAQNQVATPNPPPPPQLPPDVDVLNDTSDLEEEVVEEEDEDDEEEQEDAEVVGGGLPFGPLVGAGLGLIVLVVVACAIIIGWKALRTRKRRTAGSPSVRIAGAWNEVADRYDEAGTPLVPAGTPLETVRAAVEHEPSARAVEPELVALVATIDRAAYHADPPDDAMAESAWGRCDHIVTALRSERPPLRRLGMRVDPRPLRRRPALHVDERVADE